MEVLGDVGHVKSHFGLFGDSVGVGAIWLHALRRTYHRLGNRFGRTRCNTEVTLVFWKLVSVRLEIVLVSVQGRCTVCAKRTLGLDIVFNTPMLLVGDEAQVEAHFIPYRNSANLDAR